MKKTLFALLLLSALLFTSCAGEGALSLKTSELPISSIGSAETSDRNNTVPAFASTTSPSDGAELSVTPAPSPSPLPTPTPTPTAPPTIEVVSQWLPMPTLLSSDVFVYSVTEEKFFYCKSSEETVIPASITKLLTILYAKTLLDLKTPITPGNELELMAEHSSIAYIKSHHTLTVEQLIEGMLLPSGNDAALVLAAAGGYKLKPDSADGKEAVAVFMQGMNDYARSLGMRYSNFLNPDGYPVEGHYSCLYDMMILQNAAYQDETIRKYASLPGDNVTYYSGHTNTWKNSNLAIRPDSSYYIPEANGLKTGTAEETYTCLALSMVIEGKEYLVGLFGAPGNYERFTDAQLIAAWLRRIY